LIIKDLNWNVVFDLWTSVQKTDIEFLLYSVIQQKTCPCDQAIAGTENIHFNKGERFI